MVMTQLDVLSISRQYGELVSYEIFIWITYLKTSQEPVMIELL